MLKFFRIPFATSGDKTAIPDPVDGGGSVSYTEGYGVDYQLQKTNPAAKNIERDKMNELFFDVTTAIAELQSQGVPDFISTALNGGTPYSYALNAIVKYSGELYISIAAANVDLPSVVTKWALLPTPARLQSSTYTAAVAGGTADALTGAFVPAIAALPAAPGTLRVVVRAGSANVTTTPTFAADATAAKTIVKGSNQALVPGDIAGAGHWLIFEYDGTLDKWVLLNPATGVVPVKQIQTIGATVAANALTITLAPTNLDFRSATLGSGTIANRVVASQLSLVVPSTATLGTVSGVASRLALLAIDNAGTVELAVVNMAGGTPLDETGIINTTTIAGASNSATTVYSTTGRTGVAYRVEGYVESTQATAGTWVTAPSTIQGRGGNAMTATSSIGFGQTVQNLTASRALTTVYYNTTNKPIFVFVGLIGSVNNSTLSLGINVGGVTQTSWGLVTGATAGNTGIGGWAIVPPGMSYQATAVQGTLNYWSELR